jgi:hypothetical protein
MTIIHASTSYLEPSKRYIFKLVTLESVELVLVVVVEVTEVEDLSEES